MCLAKERIMCWCLKRLENQPPFFRRHQWLPYNSILLFSALGIPGLLPSGCSSHLESMPPSRICFHLLSWSREGAVFFAMQLVLASRFQTFFKPHVAVPTPKFRVYIILCLWSTQKCWYNTNKIWHASYLSNNSFYLFSDISMSVFREKCSYD